VTADSKAPIYRRAKSVPGLVDCQRAVQQFPSKSQNSIVPKECYIYVPFQNKIVFWIGVDYFLWVLRIHIWTTYPLFTLKLTKASALPTDCLRGRTPLKSSNRVLDLTSFTHHFVFKFVPINPQCKGLFRKRTCHLTGPMPGRHSVRNILIRRVVPGSASGWFAGISTRGKSPSCIGEEHERTEQKEEEASQRGVTDINFNEKSILPSPKQTTLRCHSLSLNKC
jgi:hypothetical protein